MRLLIVVAVAALTAILVTFALKKIDGPWQEDNSIRTGAVGAASALVAMSVSRNLRKTGTELVGSSLENYDNSFIDGIVIAKLDAKNGEVWKVIARRDHLDRNKIKFDTHAPSRLGKIRLVRVSR